MVIIDFSHLAMRNLYTSIFNVRPKKENGVYKTEQYIKLYMHQMLNSLKKIKREFGGVDEEIILAIDSRKNWRKEVYPDYKAHRKVNRDKSEIDFEEFFKFNNELKDTLGENFNCKVVEVDKAEGDDIIFVLAEKFGEKVTVITEDKDMKIVVTYGSKMFQPIKQSWVNLTDDEASLWIKTHICLGDASDNVPNIFFNTSFTDEFKAHLVGLEHEMSELEYDLLTYDERCKIEDTYDCWYLNRKGENVEKKIFKKVKFGEKTAEKFAKDLVSNLTLQRPIKDLLQRNFERNKVLIHPSGIPSNIKDEILKEYENSTSKKNVNGIMSFCLKYGLKEHLSTTTDF